VGQTAHDSNPTLPSIAATKIKDLINPPRRGRTPRFKKEQFMADDTEKKGQQGGQSEQGQQGNQPGQGQQHDQGKQTGQTGQQQPKKGGQTDNQEEDQNRDRQRRAS
jgi:hypothetical protein